MSEERTPSPEDVDCEAQAAETQAAETQAAGEADEAADTKREASPPEPATSKVSEPATPPPEDPKAAREPGAEPETPDPSSAEEPDASAEVATATSDAPGQEPGQEPEPEPEPEPPEPRWKRWGRKLLRLALLLVALGLVARVLFPVLFPSLLRFGGHQLDLEVGYDELNLSLSTGELELRGLSVEQVSGGRLVELRHLRVDVATSQLLQGGVDVERLDLDGLRIWVRRTPRGTLNWLEALEPLLAEDPDAPAEPAPEPSAPAGEVASEGPLLPDLSFFRLRGLRVEGVEIVLRDETLDPPLDSRVGLSVSLGQLHAAPDAPPTAFLVEARAPGLLTLARAEGELRASQAGASLTLRSKLEGLQFEPLRELLGELGITPQARALAGRARLAASLTPLPAEPRVLSLDVQVEDVALFADEGEVVGLDRFSLRVARLAPTPEAFELDVEQLLLRGARARLGRDTRGALQVAGLQVTLPPEIASFPRAPKPSLTPRAPQAPAASPPAPAVTPQPASPGPQPESSAPPTPSPKPAPAQTTPAPPFQIVRLALRKLSVSECSLSFADELVSPEPLVLSLDSFSVSDLVWGEATTTPASLRLQASAPGIFGTVAVVGSASAPSRRSFSGGLRLRGQDLCPWRLDPYLNALGIEREYEQGTLDLQAGLEIQAPPGRTLEGSLSLSQVSFRAGEVEWLGLDELALEGLALDLAGPSLGVGALRVRSPRARAWRDLGSFGSCGFAFRPPPQRATPRQATRATQPSAPQPRPAEKAAPEVPAPAPATTPLRGKLRLGELSLERAQVRFVDRALERTLAVEDLGCSLTELEVDLDPAAPVTSRTLQGWLVAPGLVERAELDLELHPSAQAPALRGTLSAKGLSLEPLNAYLLALGVEGLLREGVCEASFRAHADLGRLSERRLRAGLELERLALSEGARELLSLRGASLSGIEVSPQTVRLGRIALAGFATRIEREAEGTLLVPGLRLGVAPITSTRAAKVAGAGAAEAAPETPAPAPTSPEAPKRPPLPIPAAHPLAGLSLPRFEVGALHLGEVALDLRDAASELELPIRVSAGGGPLSFDLDASSPTPGPLQASIKAPGLFRELGLRGELSLGRDRLLLRGHLDLRALDLAALHEQLQRAGLELAFAEGGGTLASDFGAQVSLAPGAIACSAWAEQTSLRDAEREWLGLDRAELRLGLTPETLTLGPNVLRGPRLLIRHLPGSLEIAGARIALSAPDAPSTSRDAPPRDQAPLGPEPGPAAASAEPPRPARLPEVVPARVRAALAKLDLPQLELALMSLEGARVTLEDQTLTPAETLSLESEASLGPATLTPELKLKPLPYRLALRLPRVLEGLELGGQLSGDLQGGYHVAGDLDLSGLRAGPLSPVLPPELGVELQDGSLNAHFEAGLGLHSEQGLRAEGGLTKLSLRDGERSLLRLSEASFRLRQLAPSTRRLDLESLAFKGLELDASLDDSQTLRLLGLRLGPAASPPDENSPREPDPEKATSPEPAEATKSAQPPNPDARARARRALARASRGLARRIQAELPEFSLERVEVDLRRISFKRAGAAPVAINDLRLRNTAPLLAPAGDLANAPPWILRTEVRIAPIVSELVVVARLRPFALDPGLQVDWTLSGIQGAGALAALPELAGTILDGPLSATCKGTLRAELVTKRREPLNFHFAQLGFGARLELSGVEFREAASQEETPLAGLERLSVDVRELHPERGIFVSEVEVVRPRGRFRRDLRGLHALGFTIPLPEPPVEEAPVAEQGAPPAPAPEGDAPPPAEAAGGAPPATPRFEVKIDRLSVSKIEVAVSDESYDPPIRLPFKDLEVNLTGLTSKLLTEKGQLELECEVHGGLIPLPGSKVQVPAWRRISLDLRASLFPKPSAALELEVSGVQLTNYAGLAKSIGAELEEGQLDVEASIRLSDDARLHLASTTTLHDLTLSEGEEGPVRSWLGLPFPVGPAIKTAKVINGKTLRVPVNPSPLDLTDLSLAGLLSYGALQIPRLFGEAFATILSDAVLAAPKRLVGGITDLGQGIGDLTGLTSSEGTREVVGVEFPAGVETLSQESLDALLSVRERLLASPASRVQLEHVLGKADLARVRKLATPPAQDRLALARRCEQRVRELRRELLIVGAEAAEHEAAGSELAFQATQGRFKSIALRLARAERTLDEAYALVDESEGAPRRVSATSVALGQLRLEAIRGVLVGDEPKLANRITLRRVRYEAEPEAAKGVVKFVWKE